MAGAKPSALWTCLFFDDPTNCRTPLRFAVRTSLVVKSNKMDQYKPVHVGPSDVLDGDAPVGEGLANTTPFLFDIYLNLWRPCPRAGEGALKRWGEG